MASVHKNVPFFQIFLQHLVSLCYNNSSDILQFFANRRRTLYNELLRSSTKVVMHCPLDSCNRTANASLLFSRASGSEFPPAVHSHLSVAIPIKWLLGRGDYYSTVSIST